MLLWICFALLSAAVATLVLRPASSEPSAEVAAHDDKDMAVYRDQLSAIETDAEQGVLDPAQAASARVEIARRLLKQADSTARPSRQKASASSDRVLLAGALAIPLASLALYLFTGSPGLPSKPLAERIAIDVDKASTNDLIAKVEARLREKPDDGQGWAVIAPIYLNQGRSSDAAMAFAKAMSLVGETPERLAGFAKANVATNNGIVNEPAKLAYQRLLALDPERVEAKFWLAIAEEQAGKPDAAAAAYRAILAKGPADAPWRQAVEERLAAVQQGGSSAPNPAPAPPTSAPGPIPQLASPVPGATGQRAGPTPAEFVAAAQKLAPEMREQMIGRMVAKGQDAVKQNPKDIAAWSRIVTGYAALNKSDEAKTTLQSAKVAVTGDTTALTELEALAKTLSLTP
jgi:cytochrome c-type biogenesis protein CcmH